ncbi:DUF7284 family protein [Natronosalvus vescus]|uniref:DUF7284 family protein n=1 Tax=Natronosalvus vescus TaxID=2953881 RepID=UPI0020907264|nr:hypothetical protein [Natronosalvus vescus]
MTHSRDLHPGWNPSHWDFDARGVSTVLDVALCLVLVSAAVGVLGVYLAAEDDSETHQTETADHVVELLGSTTISVEFSFDPLLEHATATDADVFDEPDDYPPDERTRVTHGPTAGLLADATRANLTVDDAWLGHEGAGFESRLEGPIASELFVVDASTAVSASWSPYEDAPLEGRTSVGRTPPPTADVSTVTMTVPSGFDDPALPADTESDHNFDAVAEPVATTIVDGYFPPEQTTLALERGGLDRDRTVYRYTRFSNALEGVEPSDLEEAIAQSTSDAETANTILVEALTQKLASDMDSRFERPADAADAITVAETTIVVQVWDT